MTYDALIPWADWLPGHLAACAMSLDAQYGQNFAPAPPNAVLVGDLGRTPLTAHPDLSIIRGLPRPLWNRSAALNLAFNADWEIEDIGTRTDRVTPSPLVLVVDADTVLLDDHVVADLLDAMRPQGHVGPSHAAAWAICMEPSGQPRPHGMGGCILVRREAWEKVGGYDEAYEGWGGEDNDFILRLEQAGYTIAEPLPAGRVLTLWHPPVPETPALTQAIVANKLRLAARRKGSR